MNVFSFSGNLGGDAQLQTTSGGKTLARFSVAVNSGYRDNQKTTWVSCGLFGKRAESLAPYLLKGKRVFVTGEASLNEWKKDGEKHAQLQVFVNDIDLGNKGQSVPNEAPAGTQQTTGVAQPASNELDSDIPF